ncbi:MAG: type II secretion system protein GspG, partial [Acidobacteriota bacterium]
QTYPVVEGIAALGPALQPDYLKELPLADGWKNPLVFEVDTKGSTYTLRSLGKDGEPQKDELEAMTHDFAADIVMVDGVFRQRPAGKQGSDAKEKKEAS